jgi:ribosomal protein S18 acetylase RimI-like enzyme
MDYSAVVKLWEIAGPGIHLGRSDTPDEIEKKLSRDPDLFLVAEHNGKIIGSVIGGYDGRRGMMYHLAVDADYRRLGVGENLVKELESRLKSKGCVRYYLLVTKDNRQAIDFYEKRGFIHLDELQAYAKDLI